MELELVRSISPGDRPTAHLVRERATKPASTLTLQLIERLAISWVERIKQVLLNLLSMP